MLWIVKTNYYCVKHKLMNLLFSMIWFIAATVPCINFCSSLKLTLSTKEHHGQSCLDLVVVHTWTLTKSCWLLTTSWIVCKVLWFNLWIRFVLKLKMRSQQDGSRKEFFICSHNYPRRHWMATQVSSRHSQYFYMHKSILNKSQTRVTPKCLDSIKMFIQTEWDIFHLWGGLWTKYWYCI